MQAWGGDCGAAFCAEVLVSEELPPVVAVEPRKRRGGRGHPVIPKGDLKVILEAYLAGVKPSVLAAKYGVNRRAIYSYLLTGIGDEKYADMVTGAMAARIADADEALEKARDQVGVSKWSQLGKFARMDFERRRPALYGQKQQTVVTHEVTIDAALQDRMAEILERREKVVLEAPKAGTDGE